ncbi:MAG: TIGR04283 family arsenosugar biosynthesis glycosyltransferase [Myxococcales bacterium]|nr:TIGR04283 family arsenosugar biosynthesis glycosyltransferase [Myxococcales bacterium]
MPLTVTAIVPVLDESGRIAACVDHLVGLGLPVVVVDGGSTDATLAIAAERGATVVRASRGRASQMNAGAAGVRTDVLWFLHADVRPEYDAIEAIRASLADPTVVAGAFHTRTMDDGSERGAAWMRMADLRQGYTRLPYGDQGLFVRREVFVRTGGFDESLRLFEDVELARRLWREGRLVVTDPPLRVSARRFRARPVRSLIAMNLFPLAFRAGVPTEALERIYGAPR